MATLLKIGSEVINLDNVTQIIGLDDEFSDTVRVCFNYSVTGNFVEIDVGYVDFHDDAANALRAYFNNTSIATDVMKPYRAAQTQEPAIVVGACECSACNKEVRS